LATTAKKKLTAARKQKWKNAFSTQKSYQCFVGGEKAQQCCLPLRVLLSHFRYQKDAITNSNKSAQHFQNCFDEGPDVLLLLQPKALKVPNHSLWIQLLEVKSELPLGRVGEEECVCVDNETLKYTQIEL